MQQQPNKNMAKKTGKTTPTNPNSTLSVKSVSSVTPNSKQFMDQYEQTLLRNQQIDWLNGNNEGFVNKKEEKKEEKPNVANAEIPPFWKKETTQAVAQPQKIMPANTAQDNIEYKQKLLRARFSYIEKSQADVLSNNIKQPTDATNQQNAAKINS